MRSTAQRCRQRRSRPRIALGFTLTLMLAACAGTSASAPTATPGPSSDLGDRVPVIGTAACGNDLSEVSSDGGLTVMRGPLTCTYAMSDPRVSGDELSDMTVVYLKRADLEIDKWFYPTGKLTNAGGTWRASGWGSEFWDDAGAIHTSGTSLYVGEGAYAGLVFRAIYAQGGEISGPSGIEYIVAGWIEPAQ
jgi:hypothetical protein